MSKLDELREDMVKTYEEIKKLRGILGGKTQHYNKLKDRINSLEKNL